MTSSISQWKGIGRSTLVICVLTGFVAVGLSETAFAQRLKGKLADGKYTSPRSLFTVPAPKASNWAGVAFTIQEETETGDRNYDTVAFYVKDFGEVLLASVRRIPQVALDNMAKDDPQNVVKNLANKALGDWRQNLTEEPAVVEEDLVSTPYGQAALRIYKVVKGSLLQRTVGGSGKGPESFDVLIAVIVAKRNDHMISAIAENDANPLEKDRLRAKLQEFFGGVMVPEAPRFDKR
jgi:hypothetical protein